MSDPRALLGNLCFGGGAGTIKSPKLRSFRAFLFLLFEVLCVIDFYTEKEQVIKPALCVSIPLFSACCL